jgi:hypothetical protein
MYHYHIEKNVGPPVGWFKLPLTHHQTKAYCDGYVDAMDSLYPSSPHRIVKTDKDGTAKVVRETKGRGPVDVG